MADTSACRCRPCWCFSCSGRYMVVVASARGTQRRRQRRHRQVWVTVATSGLRPKPLHSLLLPASGCRSRSLKCDALLPEAATAVAAAAAFPWSIVTSSQEATTNHRATYVGCARSSRSSASSRSLQWRQLRQQQQDQQHKRIDQPTVGRRQNVNRCCRQRKPQQLPLASAARLLLLLPVLILVGAGTIASGAPPNVGPIELNWAGAWSPAEAPAAWQQAARETGRPCAARSSEHSRAITAEAEERRDQAGGPSEQRHDTGASLGQTGPSSSSSSQEACQSFVEPSNASSNRQYGGKEQEAAAASADQAKAAEALAASRPTGEATAAEAAAAEPPTQLSIAALDEYARRDTKHGTGDNEPASQQVHMKAAVTPATGTADDATTQLGLLPQPTRPSAAAAATPLAGTQQLPTGAQTLVRVLVQPLKAAGAAAAAASAAGHDAVPSSRSVTALPTASADAEFSLLQQATQSSGTRTATLAPRHSEASLFHADNIGTDAEAAADENSEAAAAAVITTTTMGRFNGDSEYSAVSDRRVGSGGHALASSAADPTVHRTAEAAGRARGLHVPRVQAVRQLGQEHVPQLLQVAADAAAAAAVGTALVSSHTPSTGSSEYPVSGWATTSPRPAAAAEAAATLKTSAAAAATAAAATAAAAGEYIGTSTTALPEGSRTTAGLQPLASAAGAVTQSATAAESHDQQRQQQKPSDPGVEESSGGGSSNVTGAADSQLLTEERSSRTTVADSRGTFATSVEPVQQQQRATAIVPSRSTEAVAPPTSRPPSYQGSELQPCEEAGSRCTGGSGQPPGRRPNAAQSAAAAVGTTGKPEPVSHNDGRGNWAIGTVAGAATGGLAALVWLIGVPLTYVFCRRRHHRLRRLRRAGTDNREARYEQHRTEHSHLEELIMLELAKARSRGYVCDSDKVNYDEVFHLNASVANQITTEL